MDLSLIKQKLDNFENKGSNYKKTDYEQIYWKPTVGKQVN